MKNYICSICGKQHVKLWRPYMGTEPLVCAECAEKLQSPQEYTEKIWKETSYGFIGLPTGRELPLQKWTINQDGKIPFGGPRPSNMPVILTDQLIIDLSKISQNYTSGETTLIPAVPNGKDMFWSYTAVPEEDCKWWENLPTR